MGLSKEEEQRILSKLKGADEEQARRFKEQLGSYEAADQIFDQLRTAQDQGCPTCRTDENVIKHGQTRKGTQQYRCKECGQTFTDVNRMPFYHSQNSIQKWKSFLTAMISGATLQELADSHDLAIKTAFEWRHKLLRAIRKLQDDTWLAGRIWADEAFLDMNEPGRGQDGIEGKKVTILTAQDYQERTFAVPVSPGRGAGTDEIEQTFKKYLVEESSTLVTDNAHNFDEYCRENNVEHETNESDSDDMNMINWLHSHFKTWYKQFRGVGADYLRNYCAWFSFIRLCCHKRLMRISSST